MTESCPRSAHDRQPSDGADCRLSLRESARSFAGAKGDNDGELFHSRRTFLERAAATLARAIQTHFRERHSPYPVERTLLTTGILAAAMDSRAAGKPVETPHLAFGYEVLDFSALREMGATWKIITPETPEPKGIDHAPQRPR